MTPLPMAALAAAAPDPEAIREAARRILEGDAYRIDDPNRRSIIAQFFEWLMDRINSLLNWLFPESILGSPTLLWSIVTVAIVLLIGLIGHIAYTFYRGLKTAPESVALEEEQPTDVETLVARARECAEKGDWVDASRLLYRAALVRLEEERGGRFQPGLTNTEYLRTFRAPWVGENLKVFVDLINWKWYRAKQFDREDYEQCRAAYERIDLRLREGV